MPGLGATWFVRPVTPRGDRQEFDDCGPNTTHALIARSFAEWRFGRPRAGATLSFDVTSPDGHTRRYIGYKQVEVAPVFVDSEPTLAEQADAELRLDRELCRG